MKVFLTGHRGYIGTVMTPMLLKAGHDVIGCDSDLYERCTFDAGGTIVDVPTISKDVRDLEKSDLKGVDAVIHLAALSNDPLGNLNPDITHAINHRASVRLAKLAKDAGVGRFLLASSCSQLRPGRRRPRRRDRRAEPRHRLWAVEGVVGARHRPARRRAISARSICARPRPTACRRACASTSS